MLNYSPVWLNGFHVNLSLLSSQAHIAMGPSVAGLQHSHVPSHYRTWNGPSTDHTTSSSTVYSEMGETFPSCKSPVGSPSCRARSVSVNKLTGSHSTTDTCTYPD